MGAEPVVILGAGPAGCAAAITAAQRGMETVIMETRPFPRFRPGEALHPGTLPLFRTLGVEREVLDAGFLRFSGVWVDSGRRRTFQPFSPDPDQPWYGIQAWREDLDRILLGRARALGTRILQPHRAQELLTDPDGTVRGVRTHAHGDLRAACVIDATGTSRWVARQLGISARTHSLNQWVQFGYVQGAGGEEPVFSFGEASGWTWIASVRENVLQWAALIDKHQLRENPDRDWRPYCLSSFPVLQPPKMVDATWITMERMAGAGYFLAGDAAGTLDPSSSHGVLRALMTGMMAGHLAPNASSAEVADGYHNWLKAWFESDQRELSARFQSISLPI